MSVLELIPNNKKNIKNKLRMKTFIGKLDGEKITKCLFITLGSALAISLFIFGLRHGEVKTICGWFTSFWTWAIEFVITLPFVVIISMALCFMTIRGIIVYKRYEKKPIAFIIPGALFFLSLFPLFNHMGMLIDFIIVLIWCLIAITVFIPNELPDGGWKAYVIVICYPLFLAYYADYFIFGCDKPYLTMIAIVLLIGAFSRKFYIKIKNWREIKKEEALQFAHKKSLAEYAETIQKEMKALPINEVFLEYLKAAKNDGRRSGEILKFINKASLDLNSLSEEAIKKIIQELIYCHAKIDDDFLRALESTMDEDYAQSILMATPNGCSDNLPMLFQVSKKKPEIIKAYLKNPMTQDFYFEAKRAFYIKPYCSLINALVFSYNKEWKDSDLISAIRNRIQELIDYAIKKMPEIHDTEMNLKLLTFLNKLQKENSNLFLDWSKIPDRN